MRPTPAVDSEPCPAALVWALPSERPDPRSVLPENPHVAAWGAHVDAGRIGHTPPSDPEIVANREATARLFARPVGRW